MATTLQVISTSWIIRRLKTYANVRMDAFGVILNNQISMRPSLLLKAAAYSALFFAVLPAFGQLANTTSLTGNIVDSSGAAAVGVEVTALNTGTQERFTVKTGNDGSFLIPFVAAGTYNITAKLEGFSTSTKTGVPIGTNQTVRVDFTLEIGSVSQNLEVSATPPPITTDDASVKETIATKTVVELPLSGRNPLQLATTTPNVIQGQKATSGTPPGEAYIGAGTREIQNNVTLDGISIMNNLISTTAYHPSPDAIQELEVKIGTYGAQYGSYLGVQANLVSKSGTNNLHGSVWEFLGNDKLNARNFFAPPAQSKPSQRLNQFGFQVNGPIYIPKLYDGRNKTFFMADYEGLRNVRQASGTVTTLTPLMATGNFSQLSTAIRAPLGSNINIQNNIIPASAISPQARRLLAYIPVANLPRLQSNFAANFPNNDRYNQTIDRLDQNIGDRARFFFRYAWANEQFLTGTVNPFTGTSIPQQTRNWVVGYTQTFTPNLVNDIRVGRQNLLTDSLNYWYTNNLTTAGTDLGIPGFDADTRLNNPGIPVVNITNYQGTGNGATNWFQTDTTWQGADSLTYTHGKHTIVAGAEVRKIITGRQAVNSTLGQFTFSGQFSGNALADFLLGYPSQTITPAPQVRNIVAQWRDGFYVTDAWRATKNLTINIGLRYELPTVPYSVNGYARILSADRRTLVPPTVPSPGLSLINPNRKNFAPRFGLAYRIGENTVIRAGFGIYYNPNQNNTFTFLSNNPPLSLTSTFNVPVNTAPTLSLANPTGGLSPASAPPSIISPNPNLPTAYMNQWSFDIQQGLWKSAALDIQYLGSHALHLDRNFQANRPFPGPGQIQPRRPNPAFADVRIIQNDVISNHEGISFALRQRFSRGLTALASYTWAHDLDVSSDSNGGGTPLNPYDWRYDYGNANWDIRHRFVGSFTYEIPVFKNSSHAALRQTLGGWQTNGILTLQGGVPFNVTIPVDQSNTGNTPQRPNIIGPVIADCGRGRTTGCITLDGFALPNTFTYGSAGRNVLRGPGLYNFDFSLFKNFSIQEKLNIQFRAEAFNLLNTPQLSNPLAGLPSLTGGATRYTAANRGNFGDIQSTNPIVDNRRIQFGLKVLF